MSVTKNTSISWHNHASMNLRLSLQVYRLGGFSGLSFPEEARHGRGSACAHAHFTGDANTSGTIKSGFRQIEKRSSLASTLQLIYCFIIHRSGSIVHCFLTDDFGVE